MDALQAYLDKKKITQKQIAHEIGVSLPMVSLILAGKRKPGVALTKRIEAVTGIPRHLIRPDVYEAAQ